MTVLNEEKDLLPWYKQGYVWLIILFPMLAVIGGIATIIIAIKSNDGLVVDDYYKQGLEINRVIERDKIAEAYNLNATIEILPETEEISILLKASSDFSYPDTLEVSVLSATRSGMDENLKLMRVRDDTYMGHLPTLVKGKWYLHIESTDWRLVKTIRIF